MLIRLDLKECVQFETLCLFTVKNSSNIADEENLFDIGHFELQFSIHQVQYDFNSKVTYIAINEIKL